MVFNRETRSKKKKGSFSSFSNHTTMEQQCHPPIEIDEFFENNTLNLDSDWLEKPFPIEQPSSYTSLNEDITLDQGLQLNNSCEPRNPSIATPQPGLDDLPLMLGDSGNGENESQLTQLENVSELEQLENEVDIEELLRYTFDGNISPGPGAILVPDGTEIGGAMSGSQPQCDEMEEQIAAVPIHDVTGVAEKVPLNESFEVQVQAKPLEEVAQNPDPGQSSSKRRSSRNLAKVPEKDKITKQVSPLGEPPCSASSAKRRRIGEKTTKMWQLDPDAVEDPALRAKVERSQSARKNREKQSETKRLLAEKAKAFEELTKEFEAVSKEKKTLADEKELLLKKIDEHEQEIKKLQERIDADNAKESCHVISSKLKQSAEFSLVFMPSNSEPQTQCGSMMCKFVFPGEGGSNDKL